MKRVYVESLREGTIVEDVFVVASRSVGSTRSGSPFLKLKLADKTGRVDAVRWDMSDPEAAKVAEGDYIRVRGPVRTYQGELQITIESLQKPPADIDPSDFIAASSRDLDEMLGELRTALAEVTDDKLKRLIAAFVNDEEFIQRFREAPAGRRAHHAYVGGLLEHTLGVVHTCARLAELYPRANRDLLLTAAALHDIGKTEEMSWSGSIRYTDAGNLVGHVVGGAIMLRDAAAKIEGFDELTSLALQHALLAHHGVLEFGSPKLPHSIEALILHYADDLDAKAAMFEDAIKDLERAGGDSLFTEKHFFLDRPLFRGLPEPGRPDDAPAADDFNSDPFAAQPVLDPFADKE